MWYRRSEVTLGQRAFLSLCCEHNLHITRRQHCLRLFTARATAFDTFRIFLCVLPLPLRIKKSVCVDMVDT